MKTYNIYLFIGAPCCGKGKHGSALAKKLDIPHINMGERMRQMKDAGKLKWVYVKCMQEGRLMPDGFAVRVWQDLMAEYPHATGWVLDGFPRTNPQVDVFMEFITELKKKGTVKLHVILIHITPCESKRRQTKADRGRDEDKDKKVQKIRLEEYTNKTGNAVFRLFSEAEEHQPINIDGSGTKNETTKLIFKALGLEWTKDLENE